MQAKKKNSTKKSFEQKCVYWELCAHRMNEQQQETKNSAKMLKKCFHVDFTVYIKYMCLSSSR